MVDDADARRRALAEAVAAIPDPADYYAGRARAAAPVPRNLLLFQRSVLRAGNDVATSHHRLVLVVCLRAPGTVVVDERLVPLAEGEALLIHPHQFHSFLDIGRPLRWLFVTAEGVDGEHLAPLLWRPVRVPALGWALLAEMVALWRGGRRRDARLALAHGLLLQTLAAAAAAQPAAGVAPPPRGHRLVERVNRALHAQRDRPLRIAALARAAGVSASHLRAAFRQAVGTSLGVYLRRARVHHARQLLRESALDIAAIARASGFGSPSAFSRAFRAVTGASPRAWRARERDD